MHCVNFLAKWIGLPIQFNDTYTLIILCRAPFTYYSLPCCGSGTNSGFMGYNRTNTAAAEETPICTKASDTAHANSEYKQIIMPACCRLRCLESKTFAAALLFVLYSYSLL